VPAASAIDRGSRPRSNKTVPLDAEDRDTPQPFVLLAVEGTGGKEQALVVEVGLAGQVGVLDGRGFVVGQVRRIRRGDQEHQSVPIEPHVRP
jgi:hypothetical protein